MANHKSLESQARPFDLRKSPMPCHYNLALIDFLSFHLTVCGALVLWIHSVSPSSWMMYRQQCMGPLHSFFIYY